MAPDLGIPTVRPAQDRIRSDISAGKNRLSHATTWSYQAATSIQTWAKRKRLAMKIWH